ncbi:alpha/beta fold hydrolase [Helicobacter canis]|uniref:alpha/beta fold hydrolase n=1 Tax=Helicobacter canis TaxID=29419 RepID=UPI0026F0127C|nr:alpha/beta fold hydrolase [Helicobacter canis]
MASRRITYLGESLEIAYIKQACQKAQEPRNIVFLHGWGSHKELMHQAFAGSFADYTHYYIDLPGFGASPYGEELESKVDSSSHAQELRILDTSDYAHIVLAFLRELGIRADIIVGHSFGGKVAVMCGKLDSVLGNHSPDCSHFGAVTTDKLAPTLKCEQNKRSGVGVSSQASLEKAKSTSEQPTPKTIGEIILLSSAGIVCKKPLKVRAKIACAKIAKLAHIRLPFLRAGDARALNPTMYSIFKRVVDEDFSPIFAACRHNVSIFWGRDDKATPLESGEKIHALIPDSRLFVLNGDHYFFINQAARIESMYRLQAWHIKVCGKVQGVGYRKFAKAKADELTLYGSTQNLPDGSVEIFACGSSEGLEQFLQALRVGPSRAQVQEVHSEPCTLKQEWLAGEFRILT